jgi:hypothetical protein
LQVERCQVALDEEDPAAEDVSLRPLLADRNDSHRKFARDDAEQPSSAHVHQHRTVDTVVRLRDAERRSM